MLFALMLALAAPADWVPARWNWTDPNTLDLLQGTPINCLLVKWSPAAQAGETSKFAQRAAERGVATLAVIGPAGDPVEQARQAIAAKLSGIVLEGDFPDNIRAAIADSKAADSKAPVIELTARSRLKL